MGTLVSILSEFEQDIPWHARQHVLFAVCDTHHPSVKFFAGDSEPAWTVVAASNLGGDHEPGVPPFSVCASWLDPNFEIASDMSEEDRQQRHQALLASKFDPGATSACLEVQPWVSCKNEHDSMSWALAGGAGRHTRGCLPQDRQKHASRQQNRFPSEMQFYVPSRHVLSVPHPPRQGQCTLSC